MVGSGNSRLVFISHSGEDTWIARQIAKEVVCCGAQYFLDEADIDLGAEFESNILKYLRIADELVVLFTPWAFDRPYVWMEIGIAWSRGIPIVVVLHGIRRREFLAGPNVPVCLKGRDIVYLNCIDKYFQQLESRVRTRSSHGSEA